MFAWLAKKCNKGGEIMNELIEWIVGTSTTLDVYVVVRLIVMAMALELFAVCCSALGSMKGR